MLVKTHWPILTGISRDRSGAGAGAVAGAGCCAVICAFIIAARSRPVSGEIFSFAYSSNSLFSASVSRLRSSSPSDFMPSACALNLSPMALILVWSVPAASTSIVIRSKSAAIRSINAFACSKFDTCAASCAFIIAANSRPVSGAIFSFAYPSSSLFSASVNFLRSASPSDFMPSACILNLSPMALIFA